ncbi:hypothetical protein [Halopseudomonas aestusnigri]|jgi:hypothetical protein|uniref:hypothetical protein n=1 Tax=Halopseudomonas aestusnigri TaxID=857252 RepID=UPI003001DD51|tara:strand:- start:2794 stop:3204 length:411 start_codon:yes stop_codon:yes gene_type:complete
MDDLQMALRIKAERKQYEDVDEVTHNRDLHRRILSTWRSSSPKMVRELEALKILDDMAFVCQERMWRTAELYQNGGMYFTDAREQAEREHLMLEPEEPLEEMEEEIIGYPMDDPMDETADWKDLLYPKVVTIQSIE